MKKHSIIIFSLLSILMLSGNLFAQINHGGHPMMNAADFSASKVLYLLEPENPMIISGLKSNKYNSYKKALNYAIEKPVDLSPEYNGEWIERNGTSIWRIDLISPGALSLGILFSEFELNSDSKIFIYDPDGKHVKGSFTAENNKESGIFYVGHIPGEELIIELQVSNTNRKYGKLRIGTLSHAFLPVFSEKSASGSVTGLGTSQDCEIDINCTEGDAWQVVKHAVCHISTSSLLCTGTLINNTSYDGEPYILTAEHCINKAYYADGCVFYFGYENSSCGVEDAPMNMSVSGSTLLATGDSLDFTLVKLSERPPREYNVYYAGWDVRKQNHTTPVALHHPNADAMKISFDFNSTVNVSSVPGDLNDYIVESNYRIIEWDIGTTEKGSSGAPLFNTSKRVIGMLSGGAASCGDSIGYDEVSDRVIYSLIDNRNDYFSKAYYDWDHYPQDSKQLKKWLDPANTGMLSIGGLAASTLDISKTNTVRDLFVYPNPTDGAVSLNFPEYNGRELFIHVYDLTGRERLYQTVKSVFPVQFSLEGFPHGVYMIRVTGEKVNYAGRIILK